MSDTFCLDTKYAHKRLDVFLVHALNDMSRTAIQHCIKGGHVRVNGHVETSPKRSLSAGDRVSGSLDATPKNVLPRPQAEVLPLDILHEDEQLLVINKQPGMVVHPATGHATGTVVNAVLSHCPDSAGVGDEMRPGVVHRLDADTSGILVLAKTKHALTHLQHQFKDRQTFKEYRALLHGISAKEQFTIQTHMGRHPVDRKKQTAEVDGGRLAISHFDILQRFPSIGSSYAGVRIETGRTHQIRVHAAHSNMPVLGDNVYAGKRAQLPSPFPRIPRQMLHAFRLRLLHPVRMVPIAFEAPLPPDFTHILDALIPTTDD